MVENINKFQQVERRLVQDLGREPLPEEIAAEMGEDLEKVNHIIKILPNQLNPVNFTYKYNEFDMGLPHEAQVGLIAQELENIFPQAVQDTDLGFKLVKYEKLVPLVISAVQEQQTQISSLSTQIATLALDEHGNLPVLATTELKTNLLSPLAPDQPITITAPVVITSSSNSETPPLGSSGAELVVEGEIQSNIISARVAILSDIQANNITARNIVADTISANHIEGLDAKLATFSAELTDSEITTITDRIKDRLSSLIGTPSATAADLPIPQEATASPTPSEVDGVVGQTNISLLDADFVTINNYLAVIGMATITTLDVTNGLYTNTISSKDNLLAIQPLGGIINLANNTLIVDSAGQVAINGDLTVSGKLLAESASINSLELGTPSATSSALGKLLAIYNEQGIAVATIDASGSADFKNISTQLITIANAPSASNSGLLTSFAQSNATAGNAVLISPNTELTISSPYVTPNSLVYLTPTGNTDNKVVFVKSKESCKDSAVSCKQSFTVAIDSPATTDISFNWWIIELANPPSSLTPNP